MYRYIVKRLVLMIPVILGVSLVVFGILALTPGDPASTILGSGATQAEMDAYALEHDISITSSSGSDALAQLVLEQKLNAELGKWVEAAEVVTTEACENLVPRDLWEIHTL